MNGIYEFMNLWIHEFITTRFASSLEADLFEVGEKLTYSIIDYKQHFKITLRNKSKFFSLISEQSYHAKVNNKTQ